MADDKPNVAGAVEPPNYTPTPNSFFDAMLPAITTAAELKVTLIIIRQTFGWADKDGVRKIEDQLSVTRLMALTGLSRQSVLDGTKAGLERGTILRRQCSAQDYKYRLNVATPPVKNLDRSKRLTGLKSRPVQVKNLDRSLAYILDPQKKEEIKERNEEGANALIAPAFLENIPEPDTAKVVAVSFSKHPAVKAYQEKHHKFPRKTLDLNRKDDEDETLPEMERIATRVGDSEESLELWKAVLNDWNDDAIAHNISVKHDKTATKWNPSSVRVLLEHFTNRQSEFAFEKKQRAVLQQQANAPTDRRGLRTITVDGKTVTLAAQPRS